MFKKFIFIFIFFIHAEMVFAEVKAKLRAIDRTTGRSFILITNLNETIIFSKLSINVKYCYQNPINMEIENYAYIIVKDLQQDGYIFEGWMFSSSPSINSLEHPINDIWLLECE